MISQPCGQIVNRAATNKPLPASLHDSFSLKLPMWRIILISLLIFAAGVFILRGPVRALSLSNDFAILRQATLAWVDGENPYELQDQSESPSANPTAPSLNPPTTFPLLILAAFPGWSTAKAVWMIFNVSLTLALLLTLLRFAEIRLWSSTGLALLAFALAQSPLHTNIALGQLAVAVTMCVVLAMKFESRHADIAAGVMFALAAALKPQMGAIFILFFLCCGRWKIVLGSVAALGVLTGIGIMPLWFNSVDWFNSLLENARAFTDGGIGDPTDANPLRFHLINLAYPLHTLIDSRLVVTTIVLIFAAALAFFAWLTKTRQMVSPANTRSQLGVYSLITLISLLVAYHRAYDAVLLAIPLLYLLFVVDDEYVRTKKTRRVVLPVLGLALLAVFVPPGAALVVKLMSTGSISEAVTDTWWWEVIILPHQAWALAGLGVVLAVMTARNRKRPRRVSGSEFLNFTS